MMVIIKRDSTNPYSSSADIYDIHDIANVEKKVPMKWIDKKNNMLTEEFVEYCRPLIQGELLPIYENGLPKHLIR